MSKLWGVASLGALCAIIFAGFWPFSIPQNQVSWASGGDGLRFGGQGIVLGNRPIRSADLDGDATIEICLRAEDLSGAGTILAFDDVSNPSYALAVRQFADSLVVQRPALDAQLTLTRYWWRTDGVFRNTDPIVLTIVSEQDKATLYVNGVPVSRSWDHGHLARNLNGTMILGSSVVRESWRGEIRGFAIYGALLSAAQIEQHSRRWLQSQAPIGDGETAPEILYSFNQGTGTLLKDVAPRSTDALMIPSRFRAAHREFLTPIWVPLRNGWDSWRNWVYWSDVLINIAGFVPFGFFIAGWLSQKEWVSWPLLITCCLGVCMSLSIECIQYIMPSRDSSMTDLLTNSLGTLLGVAFYGIAFRRTRSARLQHSFQ